MDTWLEYAFQDQIWSGSYHFRQSFCSWRNFQFSLSNSCWDIFIRLILQVSLHAGQVRIWSLCDDLWQSYRPLELWKKKVSSQYFCLDEFIKLRNHIVLVVYQKNKVQVYIWLWFKIWEPCWVQKHPFWFRNKGVGFDMTVGHIIVKFY
jgi:hypothetical protein